MNEIWKVVPSAPLYEASSHGRIRHRKTLFIRAPVTTLKGYTRVRLTVNPPKGQRGYFVHRVISEAFHGPIPHGHQVIILTESKRITVRQTLNI